MTDIVKKSKEISSEISNISQEEQAVRHRINELKRLIEERKSRKNSLESAYREEAELLKLLEGM